ncbi:MAG: histone deacetylase [Rhodobacteraceae bacterium]|nr:histone deacetylase [Paracoccaceae bacterium]
MNKYKLVAELLTHQGLLAGNAFHRPRPAPREWIELAHSTKYVDQVFSCAVPSEISREIGFPMKEDIALRARCATGGSVLAGYLALEHGLACNTAGGSHHARYAHGAGFCVFNDVAVAIRVLQADSQVQRALVIDLDVHQGDGTADIFSEDDSVFTFSMHCQSNYPVRKVPSNWDVGLEVGLGDDAYMEQLALCLPKLLSETEPHIVFYNAGVDPYEGDRLGRLCMTRQGLAARDLKVISAVRARGIPLVGVMGGGYSRDVPELADRHLGLFRAARAVADAETMHQN